MEIADIRYLLQRAAQIDEAEIILLQKLQDDFYKENVMKIYVLAKSNIDDYKAQKIYLTKSLAKIDKQRMELSGYHDLVIKEVDMVNDATQLYETPAFIPIYSQVMINKATKKASIISCGISNERDTKIPDDFVNKIIVDREEKQKKGHKYFISLNYKPKNFEQSRCSFINQAKAIIALQLQSIHEGLYKEKIIFNK